MKKETKTEKFNKVEEYTILEECRVLETGKKISVKKKVGDTAQVEGNDKVALIASGKGALTENLTEAQKKTLGATKQETSKK